MRQLRSDLSEQQFNTWIRPLEAEVLDHGLRLTAPNRFIKEWIPLEDYYFKEENIKVLADVILENLW